MIVVNQFDVSTCGMHSAVRTIFNELTNEQYNKFLNYSISGKKIDYDQLISLMCIVPLKYNIPQE